MTARTSLPSGVAGRMFLASSAEPELHPQGRSAVTVLEPTPVYFDTSLGNGFLPGKAGVSQGRRVGEAPLGRTGEAVPEARVGPSSWAHGPRGAVRQGHLAVHAAELSPRPAFWLLPRPDLFGEKDERWRRSSQSPHEVTWSCEPHGVHGGPPQQHRCIHVEAFGGSDGELGAMPALES